jgi:hypothetical protein
MYARHVSLRAFFDASRKITKMERATKIVVEAWDTSLLALAGQIAAHSSSGSRRPHRGA